MLGVVTACSNSSTATNSTKDAATNDGGGNGENNSGKANDGNGGKPDAGEGNTGGGNTGSGSTGTGNTGDASMSGGTTGSIDFDGCVPRGCDDVNATCGEIDPGCGLPLLSCDPNGTACKFPEYCGGDATKGSNQCGCKPKTCADVVSGGAKCGANIGDGCGGTIATCGSCTGAQQICGEDLTCKCQPNTSACGTKVCGTASDGCGGTVKCGANNGNCTVGDCSGDQLTCSCPPKATACGSQTGKITLPNGCSYDCAVVCNATDNANACAGANCGTARNRCGETVNCGAGTASCPTGQGCVDPLYITDDTLPARDTNGTYLGGLCLDNDIANFVGTYGVRTHAFRKGGDSSSASTSRAEALSKVVITTNKAGTTVQMRDFGCAATSVGRPDENVKATSNAPSYANIAPVDINLTLVPNAGGTGTWTRPIANGSGVLTGYTASPDYCAGKAGTYVNRPGDTRSWLKDNGGSGADGKTTDGIIDCYCPTAAEQTRLPATSARASSQDCRVVDADADGKPGFTVNANGTFVLSGSASAYNISLAAISWNGSIRADKHHTGIAVEPSPIKRRVVGCVPNDGVIGPRLCDGAAGTSTGAYDCSCGTGGQFNFIQFAPVSADYTCANVVANKSTLFSFFGSCANTSECPTGTICRDSACWPATAAGACNNNTACPSNMGCVESSCWPLNNQCPIPSTSTTDSCVETATLSF